MTRKFSIPVQDLHETLRQYQAEIQSEYTTEKAHVYFSRPMQKWIAVVRKGNDAILTFSDDCPCSKVLNGKVPWAK